MLLLLSGGCSVSNLWAVPSTVVHHQTAVPQRGPGAESRCSAAGTGPTHSHAASDHGTKDNTDLHCQQAVPSIQQG